MQDTENILPLQVEKYNLSLSGSLHNVITGRKLRHFVENTISDRVLIRYHQVPSTQNAQECPPPYKDGTFLSRRHTCHLIAHALVR